MVGLEDDLRTNEASRIWQSVCFTGVPVHGGDNKPDHSNLGAVGRKLTAVPVAPSLGRSGGVGPLCVNFPSANGRQLSTIIMEFWFRQVHQTHRVPSDHPQIHDLAWFYGF